MKKLHLFKNEKLQRIADSIHGWKEVAVAGGFVVAVVVAWTVYRKFFA